MSPRHRTPSAQVEGKILEAALSLLDEQGFRALTVRGIAAKAGVAPMGIYNRFESKTGVYDALWIEGFERLTAVLTDVPQTDDPIQDLIGGARRYRDFAIENPSYYRLMFMGSASGYEPSRGALKVAVESFNVLREFVRRIQAQGHAVSVPDADIAQSVWAVVHGQATLRMLGMCFASDPDVAYEMTLSAIADFMSRS